MAKGGPSSKRPKGIASSRASRTRLWLRVGSHAAKRRRAAFRAACERALAPLVRTAFIAERWRAARPRILALLRAWRARDFRDAALRPSRLRTRVIARERRLEGLR